MPVLSVGGFDAEELHRLSHNTMKFFGVGWVVPDVSMGPTVVKLNLCVPHAVMAKLQQQTPTAMKHTNAR